MIQCLVNHHITGHLIFILVLTECGIICRSIDNPASCKICNVVCFLRTENMSALEIHCELHVVYCQNVMSEGTVRQWCRVFKDGQKNVHNEE
jgi:hypothetical protein